MRRIQCESCQTRAEGAVCDLPPDALNDFRETGVTGVYKARQVVFSEGSPNVGLYLVCSGLLKLYQSDRFGRDHILEVAVPGSLLGEIPDGDEQVSSVSAEALMESQLCFLARDRMATLVQRYPVTGVRIIGALSREVAAARRKVRDLALKPAEGRLASLLLQLGRNATGEPSAGNRVPFAYTRRQLAEMVGVSTETAIRLLSTMKRKRIIEIERRSIVISDPEKLMKVANHDE